MMAIKLSVGFMLLRLSECSRRLRLPICAMMGLVIIATIMCTVNIFIQCIPYTANWDLQIPNAKCLPKRTVNSLFTANKSLHIGTDIVFALLPASVVRIIRRPLREKVIICVLMALGLLASVLAIIKSYVVNHTAATPSDRTREALKIMILSMLEYEVALFAACVPGLRRPFKDIMRKLGITSGSTVQNGTPQSSLYIKELSQSEEHTLEGRSNTSRGASDPS